MDELSFTPLPEGQLSEPVILPDHALQLGLVHIEGAGLRIAIWDGSKIRHMAHTKARRWANELEDGMHADVFKPVVTALRDLSDRVDEINAQVRAPRLDMMAVEGNA